MAAGEDYFWKEWRDLPQNAGYPLWGRIHIMSICLTAVGAVIILLLYMRLDKRRKDNIIKALPVLMAVLEIWKDLFLVSAGRFSAGYLPLHFCSLGIFLFLIYAWGGERLKKISGEIAVTMILPGSIAALLFPDWAVYYPPFNFMNIYSYVWHGLLIAYPLILAVDRRVEPSIANIRYDLIFIACILPPIYVFDRIFDCNYLFVNWPVPDSPLSAMAEIMGVPGYLAGYAVLVLIVLFAVYGIAGIIRRFRK